MKFFFILLLIITSIFAKDTITWMKWDLPPNFILKGPQKGTGWANERLKMLQEKLPNYNHKSTVMNLNRALQTFKDKDDSKTIYCTNDLISHPTLDIDDYMSMATFSFKAYFLVTSKEKAHLFGKEGDTIILKDIIKNKNLRLVVAKNRPYLGASKVMKEYIKENPNQKHIQFLSNLNIGKSTFSLVFKDRADYTFTYLDKSSFYGKELGVLDQLVLFQMKENEGVFYGFVSCVKTKKGKVVIEKVNNVIRELKTTDEWMNAFTKWLPNKRLQDDYIKNYKEVFLPKGDIYDDNPRSK